MRLRTSAAVMLLVTAMLVATSSLAMATVPESQKGKIGTFVITDNAIKPGVDCTYDAGGPGDMGNDIDLMEARGPKVFARDRSTRRDHQTVSTQVTFQRSVNAGGTGGWITAKKTRVARKLAYDDKAAVFPRTSWVVPIEEDYHFRALVTVRWYKPGSTKVVQGSTRQRYVYYQVFQAGPQGVELDRCLPEP